MRVHKHIKINQDVVMLVDEYNDVTRIYVRLASVRYNNQIEEEIRMCKRSPTYIAGKEFQRNLSV
jgi:hypothetical protein